MKMTLDFGRFGDLPLEQVPPRYLAWCLDQVTTLGPTMRELIRKELGLPVEPRPVKTLPQDIAERICKRWVQNMGRSFAPEFIEHGEQVLRLTLDNIESSVNIV